MTRNQKRVSLDSRARINKSPGNKENTKAMSEKEVSNLSSSKSFEPEKIIEPKIQNDNTRGPVGVLQGEIIF